MARGIREQQALHVRTISGVDEFGRVALVMLRKTRWMAGRVSIVIRVA
jgi:hypothetical protein